MWKKTIKELYAQDFGLMSWGHALPLSAPEGSKQVLLEPEFKIHLDFDKNRSFFSFFVPQTELPIEPVLASLANSIPMLRENSKQFEVHQGTGDGDWIKSTDLQPEDIIYFYCQNQVSENISDKSLKHTFFGKEAILRGPDYCSRWNLAQNNADAFVERFQTEVDAYYTTVSALRGSIDSALREAGVLAQTTFRIKNLASLKKKLQKRTANLETGGAYQHLNQVEQDIVDLGGIRISLYFPGQRKLAEKVIIECCHSAIKKKVFLGTNEKPNYDKRFSGYWATHYRVAVAPEDQPAAKRLQHPIRLEIQMSSILMNAWAEVEHDLLYKTLKGSPGTAEKRLLDQLNGLVLTGEILLEQLQKEGEDRQARIDERLAKAKEKRDLAIQEENQTNSVLFQRNSQDQKKQP